MKKFLLIIQLTLLLWPLGTLAQLKPSSGSDFPDHFRQKGNEEEMVTINAGVDRYTVPEANIGFGMDYPILPAGFFGPGSDPFEGQVFFKGLNSDGSQNPEPDAAINRTATILLPDPPSSFIVPVEMTQLQLVSQSPVRVTHDGGMVESFFDVYLEIHSVAPPGGQTEIVLNDPYGGIFSLQQVSFYPVVTFINPLNPGESYIFNPAASGLPPLVYASDGFCPWTLSPLAGEFDPIGDDDFILHSLAGTHITLIPFLQRDDNIFSVAMNEAGMPEMWSGNGYANGEWFYYPNFNWWNVWFYDHPVKTDRTKFIKNSTMTVLPRNIGMPSSIEIVYNYSTPLWPAWTGMPRPPLPFDVPDPILESQLINRTNTLFQFSGMITNPIVVPLISPYHINGFNPEWLSVDIRGWNFILNGNLKHVCFKPSFRGVDFGDAPVSYATLLANNGARHTIVAGIFMGALLDGETDGQPNPAANGDDINNLDDEDGVFFNTALTAGQVATITVISSLTNLFLQAWFDFNADGDFADAGEQVLTNFITASGPNVIPINIPAAASPGPTFARFRLSTMPGLTYFGAAPNGEVEDYRINIQQIPEFDFGDAPDPSYPTLLASNGARHQLGGITRLGNLVDSEADGIQSINASGDDLSNQDDEEGVTFLWPLVAGNPCKIRVVASVGDALFNGWIDYNLNGSWADPGEHVFVDLNLVAGKNLLTIIVPATAVPGQTYARFRFSHQPALSYDGPASDGEVEDYTADITEYSFIKWRQLPDDSLSGLHSAPSNIIADDWICNGGRLTDIHWWGNYELDDYGFERRGAGINHFQVNIHSNSGCLPGTIVASYIVPFTAVSETNTGTFNYEMSPVYAYSFLLPVPFHQVQGTVYWLSIVAIPNDPLVPPQWRWQEANRGYYPINCGAAFLDAAGFWQTFTWPTPSAMMKYSDLAFELTSIPDKTLNLKLYLEGLYAGSSHLNKAQDASGNHFAGDTADLITVELHNALTYAVIEHTLSNISLDTNGLVHISGIPYTLNGNYYVTVKHRNSIETTTASPISFAGNSIAFDFTTAASQAYGNNLRNIGGAYVIYGGDTNLDGLVDSSDMIAVDNDASIFAVGYLATDVNGDGLVDAGDMILVDNNSSIFVGSILP